MPALYAAYIYVCSAQQTFENRVMRGTVRKNNSEFDAVYNLVIDAIETFNENWNVEAKLQEEESQVQKNLSTNSVLAQY